MEKIRIGISACLLGRAVRYDGGHKLDRFIANTLGQFVDFVPVCPECECGLGVPREAMRLTGDPANPRLVTLKTKKDHTALMTAWAKKRLTELESENLCGFIFKSKSPSDGMERVKVYDDNKGHAVKSGVGIFTRLFMDHFPDLPVEEEGRLADPELRETFIENIFILKEWRAIPSAKKISGLMDFHARMKYALMARSPGLAHKMGRLLAGGRKGAFVSTRDAYFQLLAMWMKGRSTVELRFNALQHMIGFFKHDLESAEKKEFEGLLAHYRRGHIPFIVPITLLKHYAAKYSSSYLLNQYFLNPHPLELHLRNHV